MEIICEEEIGVLRANSYAFMYSISNKNKLYYSGDYRNHYI